MYLAFNFSKFADMAGNISKMAGVTHRYASLSLLKIRTTCYHFKCSIFIDYKNHLLYIFRIGEVFEITTGKVGSMDSIYEDRPSIDDDLPSDISECNGILPSKFETKDDSSIVDVATSSSWHTPNKLILLDDDNNCHQNNIISNQLQAGTKSINRVLGNIKFLKLVKG